MKKCILFVLLVWSLSAYSEHIFHHPESFMKDLKSKKAPEKKIYASFCANCHDKKPLINLGAPRIGEKADWQDRLKKPFKATMKSVNEGVGAMPQRGGCFECSDKLLEATVKYMLPHSSKESNH